MVESKELFSIPYLCGAAEYARQAQRLEKKRPPSDDASLIHRAYVVSAITTSAAALEAMINEVFTEASEPKGCCVAELPRDARFKLATVADLPKDVRSKLATRWPMLNKPGNQILDKFDKAHLIITGKRLDRSHNRWENAFWVVKLRNRFVHFSPSWQKPKAPKEKLKDLDGFARKLKLPENQLAGAASPFFPGRLLGYGYAAWSVTSALEFADHFWENIGITAPYTGYRKFFVTPEIEVG